VKKINQVFDLVRLKHLSECGHGSAPIMDLMLYLSLIQAFSHHAQIRS
jgi:hypothetical protein